MQNKINLGAPGTHFAQGASLSALLGLSISAPARLCLYEKVARDESIAFINKIYHSQDLGQRPVTIDLEKIQSISAAAALVVFAHITRLRILHGRNDAVGIRVPTSDQGAKAYAGMQFEEALSTHVRKLGVLVENGCPFSTGKNARRHYAATFKYAKKNFLIDNEGIFSALQEALINVSDHAYTGSSVGEKLRGRFWQICVAREDRIYFGLYDLGRGIPRSMKSADITALAEPDHIQIEKAMTDGISSTGTPGRGRGSVDLKRPILNISHENDERPVPCYLLVMSGAGRYLFQEQQRAVSSDPMSRPLMGTLLEWSLPVDVA